MVSGLHIDENGNVVAGILVDSEGHRIADLVDLAHSERITALQNRIDELENAQRPPTPEPPMPGTVVDGEQVMEPVHTGSSAPPGSSQTIHFLPPEEQAGIPAEQISPPAEPAPEPAPDDAAITESFPATEYVPVPESEIP
jgi:hypothetical protein